MTGGDRIRISRISSRIDGVWSCPVPSGHREKEKLTLTREMLETQSRQWKNPNLSCSRGQRSFSQQQSCNKLLITFCLPYRLHPRSIYTLLLHGVSLYRTKLHERAKGIPFVNVPSYFTGKGIPN